MSVHSSDDESAEVAGLGNNHASAYSAVTHNYAFVNNIIFASQSNTTPNVGRGVLVARFA